MKSTDKALEGKKNEPMMPVAWTHTYKSASGKPARVFTTTMGASQDLDSEGMRRLLVNATYWAVGMDEQIPNLSNVEVVGTYQASPFKGGGYKKGVRPSQLTIK